MALGARWTAVAKRDVLRTYAYLREWSQAGARKFVEGVAETVARIEQFPECGERAQNEEPEGGLRKVVCGRHVIYYRVGSDAFFVLRVWDARRDPATLTIPADPK